MSCNCATYLSKVFNPETLSLIISMMKHGIINSGVKFDAIAFRGFSGAAVGIPLSLTLNKPMIYICKPNEQSHGYDIEGFSKDFKNIIIIDDFIGGGYTTRQTIRALYEEAGNNPLNRPFIKISGIFLYDHEKQTHGNIYEGYNVHAFWMVEDFADFQLIPEDATLQERIDFWNNFLTEHYN